MNRFHVFGAAAVVVIVGTASAANLTIGADTLAGSNHTASPGNTFQGGLFNITINNVSGLTSAQKGGDIVAGSTFATFCIEIGETVGFGSSYNFGVSNISYQGGASPNDPQYLENTTAYLYTEFRQNDGFIGTVAFDSSSNTDVNALQDAIWFFQNQLGIANISSLTSNLAQQYAQQAINAGWTSIGNVRILNLGNGPNHPNQDMLALIPLPHGVGLASAGLLVLGARRRRAL